MLKSILCDSSNVYTAIEVTVTVLNTRTAPDPNNRYKEVVFKNCAPFTDCIIEINSIQIDNARYIDVVMNMDNLIEYSENYSQTFRSLWLYYRDESDLKNDSNIIDFPVNDDIKLAGHDMMAQKILKYWYQENI